MIKIDEKSVGKKMADLAENHFNRLISGNLKSPAMYYQELKSGAGVHGDLECFFEHSLNSVEFKRLIVAQPDELDEIAKGYEQSFPEIFQLDSSFSSHQKDLFDTIQKVFRYNEFRRSKAAVEFVKSLGMRACPYCNAQYLITTPDVALCEFDHIRPKSEFPYLSVSFFNLVPCCGTCNGFKSDKTASGFVDPYRDSFAKKFTFSTNIDDVLDRLINGAQTGIKVDLVESFIGAEASVATHNKLFRLRAVYNQFYDIIEEIYLKAAFYNQSRREELKAICTEFEIDDWVDRIIVGNYVSDRNFNKRPLSKFMSEIAREANLI